MSDFHSVQSRLSFMLHAVHVENAGIWGLLERFQPDEFEHAGRMDKTFLVMLDCAAWAATKLRQFTEGDLSATVPFVPTSDYREDDDKAHGENPCVAVDLRCAAVAGMTEAQHRFYIIEGLRAAVFSRYGVYCDDMHVHADIGDIVYPNKYPELRTWVRKCP